MPCVVRTSTDPSDGDRAEAHATVPRGSSRADDGAEPAVDEDLWLLHVHYRRTGDAGTLEKLVAEYYGYTLAIAQRLHRSREPLADLRQVALESLVSSLRRFDPSYGVPFAAFATPTIVGALKRHYRDQGWALRVPRKVHDMVGPARAAVERLTGERGRSPTMAEVAEALDVDEDELILALTADRARAVVSLDAPRPGAEDDRATEISQIDTSFALAEGRVGLERALRSLSDRDRTVLGLSFFEGVSQARIAERYGVSQMQVSRWIASSLARLRTRMEAVDPTPAPPRPVPDVSGSAP